MPEPLPDSIRNNPSVQLHQLDIAIDHAVRRLDASRADRAGWNDFVGVRRADLQSLLTGARRARPLYEQAERDAEAKANYRRGIRSIQRSEIEGNWTDPDERNQP
jgi:hypothetical protein